MHFWVYHKSAKQFLGPFNENTIVDFCISNKESASSFYICVNGKQNQMEWSAFAAKYAYLFENKATERELRESMNEQSQEDGANVKKAPVMKVVFVLIPLLILAGVAFFVFMGTGFDSNKKEPISLPVKAVSDVKKIEPESEKEEKIYPEKRIAVPSDDAFSKTAVTEKELYAAWKIKKPLYKELSPQDIKEVMDSFIPFLTECYNNRVSLGDRNLNGAVNIKIKVLGTGSVSDVLFTDEKYKSTLFGDCISASLKKQIFPTFKAKEQIFTYYYNF